MKIKQDTDPTHPQSMLFAGIISPPRAKDKLVGKMKTEQRDRSVSLVFKNTDSFELEVTITDGKKGGRNLRLGHELLTDCEEFHKSEPEDIFDEKGARDDDEKKDGQSKSRGEKE